MIRRAFKRKDERGLAMVEFMIVLPVILFIMLGVTEIGNLIVYGNAAGSGTPVLAGLTAAQISVTVPQPGWIRVDASYPYVPVMGTRIPSFGLGATPTMSFSLDASVTMRAL